MTMLYKRKDVDSAMHFLKNEMSKELYISLIKGTKMPIMRDAFGK